MPLQKILVVDDSRTQAMMIGASLQKSGFAVIIASDGQEALEKVFTEHPDGIILDVVLPKLSGFQVCRRLKGWEISKHIPIVLLSSKKTALDASWGLRQGADAYLTKPCKEDELVTHVRQLIAKTRSPRSVHPAPLWGMHSGHDIRFLG